MLRPSKARLGIIGLLGVGFALGYLVACSDARPSAAVAGDDDTLATP